MAHATTDDAVRIVGYSFVRESIQIVVGVIDRAGR